MKKLFALMVVAVAMLGICILPADAADYTVTQYRSDTGEIYRVYTFSWVSNASGSWDSGVSVAVRGTFKQVEFASGVTTPSAAYDVTVIDSNGVDRLMGKGADLNVVSGTTNIRTPLTTDNAYQIFVDQKIGVRVRNAGDSKSGTVVLTFQE